MTIPIGDLGGVLAKIGTEAQARTEAVVRTTARALYNEMSSGGEYSPGTPVGDPSLWKHKPPPGYVGGHARRSWSAGVDAVPDGPVPGGDAQVLDAIAEFPMGSTVYMVNSTPYSRRLELGGWSTQAPDGFVGPAVDAMPELLAEAAEAEAAT